MCASCLVHWELCGRNRFRLVSGRWPARPGGAGMFRQQRFTGSYVAVAFLAFFEAQRCAHQQGPQPTPCLVQIARRDPPYPLNRCGNLSRLRLIYIQKEPNACRQGDVLQKLASKIRKAAAYSKGPSRARLQIPNHKIPCGHQLRQMLCSLCTL